MVTPYVTPSLLIAAPTGIAWNTIPQLRADAATQLAEQTNICNRATSECDRICNQVLRATINVEELQGPDFMLTINQQGVARFPVSRWPVLSIISGQVSPSGTFPAVWTPIPVNQFRTQWPSSSVPGTAAPDGSGTGPAALLIGPGYVSWANGRNGYTVQVTYVNGWPHTSLTAASAAATTTLAVDDCTGWAGMAGTFFDGEQTEGILVTSASAQSGPGTLTLATPAANAHAQGVLFTAMPGSIQQAAIYVASALALQRGGTATTVQQMPGSSHGAAEISADELMTEASIILDSYRRVF